MQWLSNLPAIQTLSEVWKQHYRCEQGQVSRLTPKEMPPVGEWIRSPYDTEVRYGKKWSFEWMGYKVHLYECCDDDLPQLVDAGYISAKRILHSRENHAIDLIGPVHIDPSWQARTPGALDVEQFHIDWHQQRVTCPQGQQSNTWYLNQDAKGESIVQIHFPKQICQACPVRETCTDATSDGSKHDAALPSRAS